MAESPVPGLRTTQLQPVRPAAQHQLPRRVAQPDEEVRPAAVHGPALPVDARTEHHPLRSQAREHPPLQPQTLGHQNRRFRQFVPTRTAGQCLLLLLLIYLHQHRHHHHKLMILVVVKVVVVAVVVTRKKPKI